MKRALWPPWASPLTLVTSCCHMPSLPPSFTPQPSSKGKFSSSPPQLLQIESTTLVSLCLLISFTVLTTFGLCPPPATNKPHHCRSHVVLICKPPKPNSLPACSSAIDGGWLTVEHCNYVFLESRCYWNRFVLPTAQQAKMLRGKVCSKERVCLQGNQVRRRENKS